MRLDQELDVPRCRVEPVTSLVVDQSRERRGDLGGVAADR
jgi:hypothetical protein